MLAVVLCLSTMGGAVMAKLVFLFLREVAGWSSGLDRNYLNNAFGDILNI